MRKAHTTIYETTTRCLLMGMLQCNYIGALQYCETTHGKSAFILLCNDPRPNPRPTQTPRPQLRRLWRAHRRIGPHRGRLGAGAEKAQQARGNTDAEPLTTTTMKRKAKEGPIRRLIRALLKKGYTVTHVDTEKHLIKVGTIDDAVQAAISDYCPQLRFTNNKGDSGTIDLILSFEDWRIADGGSASDRAWNTVEKWSDAERERYERYQRL